MNLELYLAFTLATAILIVMPGPVVALILANSVAYGPRQALVTLAGVSSAIVLQLVLVAFGMATLMGLLSEWFEWLRWAGVAYLIYLGVRQWRAVPLALDPDAIETVPRNRLYWQGFIVNATNPKTLFFYAAFFPQFVDTGRPMGFQLLLLCVTFLAIQILFDSSYLFLGGRLRGWLIGKRRARLRNRVTGTLMIGAGLGLALVRRS